MEKASFCLLPVGVTVRRFTTPALTAPTGVLRLTKAVHSTRAAWASKVEATTSLGATVTTGTVFVRYVNNYLKYKQ